MAEFLDVFRTDERKHLWRLAKHIGQSDLVGRDTFHLGKLASASQTFEVGFVEPYPGHYLGRRVVGFTFVITAGEKTGGLARPGKKRHLGLRIPLPRGEVGCTQTVYPGRLIPDRQG